MTMRAPRYGLATTLALATWMSVGAAQASEPGPDTLPIHIKIASELIAGRVFTAQVRIKKASTKVDATLTVVLTATGADVVLTSADSARLTKRGPYEGFWDVQLAPAGGGDPVTTLGYGAIRIHNDVTRATT